MKGKASDTAGPGYGGLELALLEQLKQQPDLHIARLMLLELYFKDGRRGPFATQARKLHQRIQHPDKSFEWQRCASMGRLIDPANPLFASGSAEALAQTEVATARAAALKMRRFGEQPQHADLFKRLEDSFRAVLQDKRLQFMSSVDLELLHAAGRPSSLLHLRNLSDRCGGAQIYLKREDLSPRDTHLTMNVIGQALFARHLGRKVLVTSTVNGKRGEVAASVAARYGMNCVIYMDSRDNQKHFRSVLRMSQMEADVQSVDVSGLRNGDIREVALEHWASNESTCFMVTGLDAVPDPYPSIQREFIASIGRECRRQVQAAAKRPPDVIVARGRETADALGLFNPFVDEPGAHLVCVDEGAPQAAQLLKDRDTSDFPAFGYLDKALAPDVIEGLAYPSVEREHNWLMTSGRVEYAEVDNDAARRAVADLARYEGIIVSPDIARPLAWACEEARRRTPAEVIVVMMAERGEDALAAEIGARPQG